MAERVQEPESETEATLEQASPAAVSIALGRTSRTGGKPVDVEAVAFLRDQRRLINLQTEHLHEQRQLQLAHLRVRRWKDRMSLVLQALGALLGIAVAGALAVMVWQAHEDHGLVIQAFAVPPDLAARGLSGDVVASQLLDKLAAMQAKTDSARPAPSYQNNWGDDLKVEIPETGVSVAELSRWLRQALGNQTRITGEVFRTPAGITVSVRTGHDGGASFSGSEADLDGLLQQAAETVYRRTQPYRYAVGLVLGGKPDEGIAALTALADGPAGDDRTWAASVLSSLLPGRGDLAGALARAQDAVTGAPEDSHALDLFSGLQAALGHDQDAEVTIERADRLLRERPSAITPIAARMILAGDKVAIAEAYGNFGAAVQSDVREVSLPDYFGNVAQAKGNIIYDDALQHDGRAADRDLARALRDAVPQEFLAIDLVIADAALGRWAQVLVQDQAARDVVAKTTGWQRGIIGLVVDRQSAAYTAFARAMMGDVPGAQAQIAATPADCFTCVRMRGRIAAVAHDWPTAGRWFAEAARQAPSLPFAYAEWGEMLLAKGDADAAIAKFQLAHAKGPHFADPLELWGEALMKKGDFAAATTRFAEAAKDAPNWGRNRLRWGEAAWRSGDPGLARAQFEAARGLDLDAPDRAALNVFLARIGKGQAHG